MRSESPGKFCALVTSLLSVTACLGHMISGALVVYVILVTCFLLPAILSQPSLCSFFAGDQLTVEDDEIVPKAELFDALSNRSDGRSDYSLDRELGIVAPYTEREGSSSKSSIRIVPAHFSGRIGSAGDVEDRSDSDDSVDGNLLDEPFEMISSAELQNDALQAD